jgi:hypothetical protein
MPQLLSGDPTILATEKGRRWYDELMQGDPEKTFATAMEIVASLQQKTPPIDNPDATRKAWHNYADLADEYNDPGQFSAIIGYEWTAIGGFNLHRNVLFRGDSSEAKKTLPFSQFDSQNPEDLWRALQEFSDRTGAQVLAIPHNGNLSNGRMFNVENFDGSRLNEDLARLRAKMEPIMEVTQIKGDGEAHPFLSPDDEFADYETWDVAWSGERKPGSDGKLPAVGNTVDVASATWSNSIGQPELITVWQDPDFDKSQSAFYYARVIEIPTPRWTAYEAKRFGVKMPDKVPMTTQERAYTSPIWYTP